jgi:hypothetical protein
VYYDAHAVLTRPRETSPSLTQLNRASGADGFAFKHHRLLCQTSTTQARNSPKYKGECWDCYQIFRNVSPRQTSPHQNLSSRGPRCKPASQTLITIRKQQSHKCGQNWVIYPWGSTTLKASKSPTAPKVSITTFFCELNIDLKARPARRHDVGLGAVYRVVRV